MRRLALLLALLAVTPATAQTVQPFVGAVDFRAAPSEATAAHARVWITERSWEGSTYRLKLGTGPQKVVGLSAIVWCSAKIGGNDAIRGRYVDVEAPRRNATLSLAVPTSPGDFAPCWAAIGWRRPSPAGAKSQSGVEPVGFLWPVNLGPTSKSAARVAGMAVAPPPGSGITSLPYRVRFDPLVGLPPAGLQVCYLGPQRLPGPVWAGETYCPGETRTAVNLFEWIAACRNLVAERGVSEAQAETVRTACARFLP